MKGARTYLTVWSSEGGRGRTEAPPSDRRGAPSDEGGHEKKEPKGGNRKEVPEDRGSLPPTPAPAFFFGLRFKRGPRVIKKGGPRETGPAGPRPAVGRTDGGGGRPLRGARAGCAGPARCEPSRRPFTARPPAAGSFARRGAAAALLSGPAPCDGRRVRVRRAGPRPQTALGGP